MSLLRRLLPRPLLSLLLWATWVLLNNSLDPGHILLGFLLAILVPLFTIRFWNPQSDLKRPLLMVRYVLILLYDIVVANFEVARKVLGRQRALRPAFIEYPLELSEDFPIVLLAGTISLTPGTVSAQISADRKSLLIHVLDVEDEQALVTSIKNRYEIPLREMFPC